MKPRLLDLFCGAGGAAKGYQRAGYHVIGVDIDPQPHYCGDEFYQADALVALAAFIDGYASELRGVSAIHASPPCQAFTVYGNNKAHVRQDHPNLIPQTRELLEATGLPYVIENVPRAPLRDHVQICGTGLGVRVRRHRWFETNWPLQGVACDHGRFTDRIYPGSSNRPNGRTVCNIGEYRVPLREQKRVMQVDWDVKLHELSQMVPPAYTEFIGTQLLAHLSLEAAA